MHTRTLAPPHLPPLLPSHSRRRSGDGPQALNFSTRWCRSARYSVSAGSGSAGHSAPWKLSSHSRDAGRSAAPLSPSRTTSIVPRWIAANFSTPLLAGLHALTCALARARILLLLPILFTTTCAWSFHPPGAWSSRLHALRRVAHGHGSNGGGFSLRPAASPRPAASATSRQPANMNAGTGAGTALVAAENRQHNGFMHVEGPTGSQSCGRV